MIGTYLVHGWLHLFMLITDCLVQVGAWLMHLFMVHGLHLFITG
jgi:hypothetical protein